MTMSIGGVTIPLAEQPDAGSYPFARAQRWVSHGAIGLTGTVDQMLGTDGYKFRQRFTLSQDTMDDLNAIYVAQASGAGPYAYINDDLPEPYATGFDVNIIEFAPELAEENRGLPWFSAWIGFSEVVT